MRHPAWSFTRTGICKLFSYICDTSFYCFPSKYSTGYRIYARLRFWFLFVVELDCLWRKSRREEIASSSKSLRVVQESVMITSYLDWYLDRERHGQKTRNSITW